MTLLTSDSDTVAPDVLLGLRNDSSTSPSSAFHGNAALASCYRTKSAVIQKFEKSLGLALESSVSVICCGCIRPFSGALANGVFLGCLPLSHACRVQDLPSNLFQVEYNLLPLI